MSRNVTIAGASYSAVPAIEVPATGGGTATFTDVSDTTAAASDVAQGTYFYTAQGIRTAGTSTGGGGGTITQDEDGYITISEGGSTPVLQTKSVTPSETVQTVTADTGYDGLSSVSVGAISRTYVGSGIPKKAAATYTPTTTAQTIAAGQYLNGAQTIAGSANLIPGNIKSGVNIFNVVGNYTGGGGEWEDISSYVTYSDDAECVAAYNASTGFVVIALSGEGSHPEGEVEISESSAYIPASNNVPAFIFLYDAALDLVTNNLTTTIFPLYESSIETGGGWMCVIAYIIE